MSTRSIVLFISFTILAGNGGSAQSPCPEIVQYKTEETGIYAIIHIIPSERVSSINIKVNFTIAARLSSNSYLGRLKPLGNNQLKLIQQFNQGVPIDYELHFPVLSPVPRITSIVVNDELLCSGPPDKATPHHYVTSVSLSHILYLDDKSLPTNPGTTTVNRPALPTYTFQTNSPTGNTKTNYIITYDLSMFHQNPTDDTDKPWGPVITWQTERPRQTEIPRQTERPRQTTRTPPPTTHQEIPPTTVRTTTTTQVPEAPRPGPNECGVNINFDSVPLIYNGMEYTRGEWPWLVAIFKRKDIGVKYVCSGTLISDRHVLTAAHCMHGKTVLTSINDIVVKAGVHNILDWDDDVTVTRVLANATIHEAYNASTLVNDILMLTFTRPIQFNSYIKPACLWSGNVDLALIVGASGVVTGWGVSEIGPAGRGEPRMVRMPIVSTATCRASKPDFHRLTSSKTLCAGDRNGAGPCFGDSGGGLYLIDHGRWKLRGIVSLSLRPKTDDMSCNLDDYVVFTDTAQYLPWINSVMKANQ